MNVLKLAAKLIYPESLSHQQRRRLADAVALLDEAISGQRGRDAKLDELRERTLATADDITRDTTIERLSKIWLEEIVQEKRVQPQTVDRYTEVVRRAVIPALGDLKLSEITVGVLDRFLKALSQMYAAQARHAKTVLNQMLGMAVRHGGLPTNPIRDVGRLRKPRKTVVALSMNDLQAVRSAIRKQQEDQIFGPRRTRDLGDIVDLMLATGARISEILALRWQDIDLERQTLTVCGTMVFVKGQGWHRQDWPKTQAGHRTVFLPLFAVTLLLERRPSVRENDLDAVFVSRNGTWLQTDNVRRAWREVRIKADLEWVTPHVFRKTVATLLNEEGLGKAATAQLGHSSEDITKTYYIVKPSMAPDVSAALELLGPRQPALLSVDGESRQLIQARIAEAAS